MQRTGGTSRHRAGGTSVRRYRVLPKEVNCSAASYRELYHNMEGACQTGSVEPPYVSRLTLSQLEELVELPLRTGIPAYTQSTEREREPLNLLLTQLSLSPAPIAKMARRLISWPFASGSKR